MSFIGPVNRLGDTFVRPHDIELMLEPTASTEEAMVERVVHLGFEVRVELALHDGAPSGRRSRASEAEQLELQQGQIVYVRPAHSRVFGN